VNTTSTDIKKWKIRGKHTEECTSAALDREDTHEVYDST